MQAHSREEVASRRLQKPACRDSHCMNYMETCSVACYFKWLCDAASFSCILHWIRLTLLWMPCINGSDMDFGGTTAAGSSDVEMLRSTVEGLPVSSSVWERPYHSS